MSVIKHVSENKKAERIASERQHALSCCADTQCLLELSPSELDMHIDGLTNFTEVRDLVKYLARIILTK